MKKRGFTIIEITASFSLILISLFLFNIYIGSIKDYKSYIVEKKFLNELYSLINYSRETCINLGKEGTIECKETENIICLKMKDKYVKTIEIPQEIKYLTYNSLKISRDGNMTSTTFAWKVKETEKVYRMTIGVGINTIRIYEE